MIIGGMKLKTPPKGKDVQDDDYEAKLVCNFSCLNPFSYSF